jgi:membrane-associated protease RseP (regulator of RpoE activity)
VSEWCRGAPEVGMRCSALVDSPSGTLMWGNANPSYSDGNGDFTLDGAAAGSSRILCDAGMPFYSNGIAHVTVADGQPAAVTVLVVERREGGALGDTGAVIASDSALVARIASLDPQGAFARAGLKLGDVIASVDGTSLARLAPMGIQIAIGDRPLGSHAAVGVTRADKELVADVAITTPAQF